MLADSVEWHMRQRLKPILFDDAPPHSFGYDFCISYIRLLVSYKRE
jgi:hypothetical protein